MNIITTNSHVPYLHLLSKIPDIKMFVFSYRFSGRDWNKGYREKPANIFHIPVDEPIMMGMLFPALLAQKIDFIILHSFQDLEYFCTNKIFHEKQLPEIQKIKKFFIFHNSMQTEFGKLPQQEWEAKIENLKTLFQNNNITPVAISQFKAETWGIPCHVITPGVDTNEFDRSWTGVNNNYKIGEGFPDYSIRVCSNMEYRDFMNGYRVGNMILSGVNKPTILLGEGNENNREKLPQQQNLLSQSLEHYKTILRQSRFYLSTNMAQYEDWYNFSSLEAIAMGVPCIFTTHMGMKVIPGITKFFPIISEDIGYLQEKMNTIMKDYEFAKSIAEHNKGFINQYFPLGEYISKWKGILKENK